MQHHLGHRAGTALTGLALLVSVSACQTAPRPAAAPPASGSSASASISAAPASGHREIPAAAFAKFPPFTGTAVQKYGQSTLRTAFREIVNYTFLAGWDPALITKGATHLSGADLAYVRSYLTPKCRAAFDAVFARVITADKQAIRKLEQAVFFGVAMPGGLKPIKSGHVVTDRRFTKASVSIDHTKGQTRLVMAFAAKANIQMQDPSGARHVLPTGRVLRYWLVPNVGADRSQRPFLIDTWAINMSVKSAV
jgi:hypothetical protein